MPKNSSIIHSSLETVAPSLCLSALEGGHQTWESCCTVGVLVVPCLILGKMMKSRVISVVEASQLMVDNAVYNTIKREGTVSPITPLQMRH